MTGGQLYIDGIDAYATWGILIVQGGYKGMATMPKLKSIDTNDWQEEDGIEADLEAPVLDTRSFSISLGVLDVDFGIEAFLSTVCNGAYHTWNFAEAGRTLKLRVTSFPDLDSLLSLGTFSVKVSDDFPLDGYDYLAPSSQMGYANTGFKLDNVDLASYGIRVTQGTLDSFRKPSDIKENMLRNIDTVAGAIYDGKTVTKKSRTASIKCLMRAGSNAELWRNYDALLYNLSKPNERKLAVKTLGGTFPCYYSDMSVSEFVPVLSDGLPAWLEFTLKLILTTGSAEYEEGLFASEDGYALTTEDGYCIVI